MDLRLVLAASLLAALGLAHSYLGERYLLVRLFRRSDLPKLLGSDWFTRRTLRFAWHLTTLTWWGLAGILLTLAEKEGASVRSDVLGWIAGVFLTCGVVALLASRARHLAWIVFLAIAALVGWVWVGS